MQHTPNVRMFLTLAAAPINQRLIACEIEALIA